MMLSVVGNLMGLEHGIDELLRGIENPADVQPSHAIPGMNVVETPAEFRLTMELPGVAREDVKLTLDKNLLSISGERKPAVPANVSRWLRNELWTGSFARAVELPTVIQRDGIQAEMRDGVLSVTLPKAEEAKPRSIDIR